jgi:hypothetical protein
VLATPSRLTVLAAGPSLVSGGLLVGAAAPSQAATAHHKLTAVQAALQARVK